MYLDVQNLLSDDQDISQDAGTYYSTNALDLNATPRAIGPGEVVKIMFQMTATLVGATATMQVDLVEGSSATVGATNLALISSTGVQAVGVYAAGYQFMFTAPMTTIGQRYLRMRYIIATATTSAGTCSAGVVWDMQTSNSDWPAETGR